MRIRRVFAVVSSVLALGLGLLWLAKAPSSDQHGHRLTPRTEVASSTQGNAHLPREASTRSNTTEDPHQLRTPHGGVSAAEEVAQRKAALSVPILAFRSWLTEQLRGDTAGGDDGLALARQRRAALKELIRLDPEAALAHAIPTQARKKLPSSILDELEKPIDARGSYEVLIGCGDQGAETDRWATIGGVRYSAHVYGRRLASLTKENFPIHGIAIDRELAMSEEPFRRLLDEEVTAPGAIGGEIAVLSGDSRRTFSSPDELAAWARSMSAAEALPNPSSTSVDRASAAAITADWTMGTKTLLWIKMEFSDDPGAPATDSEINTSMATINQFYRDVSANRTSFEHTIVPVLFRTTETKSFFNANPNEYGDIRDDALQAARDYDAANGNTGKYNPDRYDRHIVVFKRVTGFTIAGSGGLWAGRGALGGKGIWLNGTVGAGTTAHELGHNQGLPHSHAWKPTGTSPIQPGEHVEYGEPFDIMGLSSSIPAGHFNTKHKNTLLYLPETGIKQVSSSGTYRIYRHDHAEASGTQVLKVNLGNAFEYWIEHRRQLPRTGYAYGEALRNGVTMHWGKRPSFATGTGTYLLDHTPGTAAGMDDSPVPVGSSFTDPDYGFSVTPVGIGGTAPAEWIDVLVSFGATGSNRNPAVAAEAPPGRLLARTDITFTATGSDPDGDTVYYRWDFGDSRINPTTATVTHRWLKGGDYTVTCNALDGKGGIASSSFSVRVEDPLLNWTKVAEGLTGSTLYGIAYGKSQFVAVGSSGTILVSPDGEYWIRTTTTTAHSYMGIQTDGTQFIAVGQRYDTAAQASVGVIMRSSDGITWMDQTPEGNPAPLYGIAWGNGRWVAVGLRGLVCTSIDGITWKTSPTGSANNLYAIQYAAGKFLVGGATGTLLLTSDGITWENRTVVSGAVFYGLARHGSRWYASNGYETWSSTDGRDWTALTTNFENAGTIYALQSSSQFGTMLGCMTNERIAISDDGASWDALSLSAKASTSTLRSMAEGNGLVVAVGSNGIVQRAGTPRLLVPRMKSDLRHGVSAGRTNILEVSARDYAKVQLLVDGKTIDERSGGDNVSLAWIPQKFGTYTLQLRGVSSSGDSIMSTQQIVVGLDRWQWIQPRNPGNNLRELGYALGRYWAVGDLGSVLSSQDGQTWDRVSLPMRGEMRGVAGDSQRVVLASLGTEGSSNAYYGGLWTSTDGTSFTPIIIASKPTANFYAVTKADGRWMAAGSSGTIVTSTNGTDWTALTTGHSSTLYSIAYGGGRWTALGSGNIVLSSTDGTTWTRLTVSALGSSDMLYSVDYRDDLWIAVGPAGKAIASSDGITWKVLSVAGASTNTLYRVRAAADRWVIAGSAGLLLTSTDGTDWTPVATARKGEAMSIAFLQGRWFLAGTAGEIQSGASLEQLAATDTANRATFYCTLPLEDGVLIGGSTSDGIAVRSLSPLHVYKQGAGLSPVQFEGAAPGTIYALAAGTTYRIAVGSSGRIYRSTDGQKWTAQNSGEINTLYGVAIGTDTAVVVGNSGRILSSSNGIDWTARISGVTSQLRGIAYGGGQFVAIGAGGTILTSPDGHNWTKRTSDVTTQLLAVAWSEATGFVVTGDSSTVLQSQDGVAWTYQRLSTSSESLASVGVTPFGLITGSTFTNLDRCYVSADGRKWTSISMPTGVLYGYSHSGSTLWAVGSSGRFLSHPIGALATAPSITAQPQSQSLYAGQRLTLSVQVDSDAPVSLQWMKDGTAIPGATQTTLEIPAAKEPDSGTYTLKVSNVYGSIFSQAVSVTVSANDPESAGRLTNLSIRTRAGTGEQTLIVGLTLDGSSPTSTQPILMRAVGPTLATFGVGDILADPRLRLLAAASGEVIASNDDWGGENTLVNTFKRLSAFAFASASSKDAALIAQQTKGTYTIQVTGAGSATGIVLAEVYDATEIPKPDAPRLVNVSARTTVGTGDNVLIAGFAIGGRSPCRVLIRAVGPQLRRFGLPEALADPKLELFLGTKRLYENDDWGGGSELAAAFTATYAFMLDVDGKDAALLVSLAPGAYTVQISGSGGSTGIALVEVYQMP